MSGDYVVDNFAVDIREWAQKDGNKGIYGADEFGLYNGKMLVKHPEKWLPVLVLVKHISKDMKLSTKRLSILKLTKQEKVFLATM